MNSAGHKIIARGVIRLTSKRENRKRTLTVLPEGISEPMIELKSNREAVIEGCIGIVEYNDTTVSINCKKIIINLEGSDLNLRALTNDIIEVTGIFSRISFS